MGYFPNGTAGMDYEAKYCEQCVHQEPGCAVWLAHMLRNYDEANNDDSILHMLIPLDGVQNKQCRMFHPKTTPAQSVEDRERQKLLDDVRDL